MKNIIKYIVLIMMILSSTGILKVYAWTTYQDFPTVKLRHWYTYNFHDTVNANSKILYVSDYNWSTFSERNWDYNGWKNPSFGFTDSFLAKWKQVNPHESEIAFESKSGYSINYHPTVRKSDNLFIKYQMQYYTWEWDHRSSVKTHIENQPYTITWCGDWVRDDYIDKYSWDHIKETCDPNDSSHSGWGTGGCSNTCEPVEAQPVCNGLSYETTKNPIKIGVDDLTKNVSCTATNATKIKIDCWNWETQEFDWNKTGKKTVSKSCTYTTAGTYTPTCYVNKTITNNGCEKDLTVLNPTPDIEIIKTDFNPDDEDGHMEDDSQTVIKWNKAVFKITVKNIGGEDLKNVVINDPKAPACNRTAAQTKALYKTATFKKGASFYYTCEKDNTQANYTNTADVTWKGVTSGKNVDDTDPTQVKIVTPSCTNLTADPNKGTVTFKSNFVCTAQYASSYKIEIKDSSWKIIKTINGNDWSYDFSKAGTYTASCYINNKNTTEQACIKTIKANPAPKPSIKIDKTDENPNDRDNNLADTQTVYKWDKAVFRITVTNNGNEDLKNVVIKDSKAPDCNRNSEQTKKLYKTDVFKKWASFTYTCKKDNTQANYTNTADVNAIGVWSKDKVDDTDPTDIKVVEPVCTNLNVDPTSGDVTFTSKFTCAGQNVDTYKILVKDNSGSVLKTINSKTGQYVFDTAGTYSVECYMNDETETESVCKKTVTANEDTNPSITIDKTDDNASFDQDTQVGNDTQTVKNWDKARFRITVTNNGTEDLKNIVLTDEKAANCAGNVTLASTYPSTFSGFTISWDWDHTNSILEPGESFTYTCEKDNTTQDYTNSATVNAKSTKDDAPVDATDTTEVKTGVYDLALIKEVVNPKSSYKKGDIVEFNIAVKNQWTIDAHNVNVVDYIPEGLKLSDVSWTQTGSTKMLRATRNIWDIAAGDTKTVTITFKITATSWDITNWSEISSTGDNLKDCDSTPDTNKNNDAYKTDFDSQHPNPEGCNKDDGDEDDHDPATIKVLEQKFDLALRKTTITAAPYTAGKTVEYKIEVFNQWDITATWVVVTDYIPTNMELVSGDGWSNMTNDRKTTNTIDTIAPNDSKKLTIKLVISAGATGTIKNYAEISADNGEDCDSTTDNTNKNTAWEKDDKLVDNSIGGRCDGWTWDEDDHDVAAITIESNWGGGWWGGWSGWNPVKCYDMEVSWNNVTCKWNSQSESFAVICDTTTDWNTLSSTIWKYKIGNGHSATFNCETVNEPRCFVYDQKRTTYGGKAWRTSNQCKINATKTCWDGRVDTPNDVWQNEECDLGTAKNGPDSACSSSCKLNSKKPDFKPNCKNSFSYYNAHKKECDKTNTKPTGWELEITNMSNFAIGNNQKVFKKVWNYYEFDTDNVVDNKALFVKNIWDDAMYFDDYLCIIDRWDKWEIKYWDSDFNWEDKTILSWNDEYCENEVIWFLYPGETKYFNPYWDLEKIKWDTTNFGTEKIKTSHLVLTVKNGWTSYDWSPILSGHMFVTVAKPTVASQWGWTTYIADSNKITNVNKVAKTVNNYNGTNWVDSTININQNNFVATVLGSGSNLSNVDTIDDSTLTQEVKKEATELEKASNVINTTSATTSFESYRGLDNVFIKTWTGYIWTMTIDPNKSVTYIIENGDLIIDKNIDSNENIAFIVKWWDIIIKDNVTKIDGTYVDIWGKIISDNTSNKLTVNGTIYGDTEDLFKNRTHISMDQDGNISVWTLVSYGSNILKKPAPLVGQFIKEYTESTKVAQ